MYLSRYLRAITRRVALVLVVTIILVAVAAVLTLLQQPSYTSTSKVFVSTGAAASVTDLNESSSFTQQVVKSYVDVATTPYVLSPVISSLHLSDTPAELADRVTASAPIDTVVIEITAVAPSASEAAQIANAVSSRLKSAVVSLSPATASAASAAVTLTTLQLAVPSPQPTSPSIVRNLLIALIGGLAVGIVLAILRDRTDRRVRDLDDIVRATGASVIGTVSLPTDEDDRGLLGPRQDRREGESFRVVKAHLTMLDERQSKRSLVVTSSTAGEGILYTAANLAATVAASGSRVLLIEADLREPTLAGLMGTASDTGVADVLSGSVALKTAIRPWGAAGLQVLTAGSSAPNPGDLLQSRAMADLIELVETMFDLVVLSCPPMDSAVDAAVLAKRASGVLFICALGRADAIDLADAVADVEQLGAVVVGIVAVHVKGVSGRREARLGRTRRGAELSGDGFNVAAAG